MPRQAVACPPLSACHVWWWGRPPDVRGWYRLRRKPSSYHCSGVEMPGLTAAYLDGGEVRVRVRVKGEGEGEGER